MKKLRGKLIIALCLILLLPAILLASAGSLPAVYEERSGGWTRRKGRN